VGSTHPGFSSGLTICYKSFGGGGIHRNPFVILFSGSLALWPFLKPAKETLLASTSSTPCSRLLPHPAPARHARLLPAPLTASWTRGFSAVLPALCLMLPLVVLPAAAQAQVTGPQPAAEALRNVVSLSAGATVEVAQDWLTLVFAVTREGSDPAVVQTQLREALHAALTEARRVARPEQVEVRTGGFSLQPRYAPVRPVNGGANTTGIVGWQGTAELVVEGRDTTAIAALPGRLSTMRIASTGFSLSRQAREKVESEVTAQAIAQFRQRADEVAKAFGFGTWMLREVSVQGSEPGMPRPMLMRAQAGMAMADESLPVEAGRSGVSVSVVGTVQLMP
jgi:predicted secreted protein